MTMLEARKLPLPLPITFRKCSIAAKLSLGHKQVPLQEMWPSHWNDVRFNYLPQNMDRRCFVHDNLVRRTSSAA